jgi:hypothetical protein
MAEMVAALATLAPRVRLQPTSEGPVRPRLLVTLRPADPLPMRIEHRVARNP